MAAASTTAAAALLFIATQQERKPAAAAAGSGQPSSGNPSEHAQYRPVYDIEIEGKNFPEELPVFIEVAKVRL